MKKWRIVGFDHDRSEKSLIYKQKLTEEKLIQALRKGIEKGCNLFSIRGFEEKGPVCEHIQGILEDHLERMEDDEDLPHGLSNGEQIVC